MVSLFSQKIDTVHIVMSCDQTFSGHLKVVLNSALFFSSKPIHLFLIVRNKSTADFFKTELDKFRSFKFTYSCLIFDKHDLYQFILSHKFNHRPECYFRLCLSSILPSNLHKVIYLDTDLIINGDLSELYDHICLGVIAGVRDVYAYKYSCQYFSGKDINLNKYINAGVMLINLDRWRKLNYEKKMLSYFELHWNELPFLDQDIINIIAQEEIHYLGEEWNCLLLYGHSSKNLYSYCIFHTLGPLKGDSFLYYNFYIVIKYKFWSKETFFVRNMVYVCFVYIFITFFVKKFMFTKAKFLYRFSSIKFYDLFFLFFIFHPFVFYLFVNEVKKRYKKSGLKGVFNRVKEFI